MKKKLLTTLLAICMIMSMSMLAACGGSGAEGTETAEPQSAADPVEKFEGEWKLAAAESQGVYMAGNFTEVLDSSGSEGSWEISSEGASVTYSDSLGTHTCPVKKLGDDIVVDSSELLNGSEYLLILSK